MRKLAAHDRAYDLVVAEEHLFYRVSRTNYPGQDDTFVQHDLTRGWEVSEQDYNQAKYRGPLLPYQAGEEVAFLPNGDSLRCAFQDSIVRRFSPMGQLLRELPTSIESVMSIYSIALDAEACLWTAVPSFHQVAQYEVDSAQKLYEVGGSWDPTELNHPEEVICYENDLFISDMGNKRLVLLDTQTKALSTYRTFTQSMWQYRRLRGQEVVRLQDGLYVL